MDGRFIGIYYMMKERKKEREGGREEGRQKVTDGAVRRVYHAPGIVIKTILCTWILQKKGRKRGMREGRKEGRREGGLDNQG